ncbi:hypothetical protein GCM10011490_12480 [Pseudoclavibacter endophyticus]|uniref:DUF3054 domain-containing protein n=1 Tax=Pseudoclavibacter endophyticus TaxID=1778590 RepID=A0A6H9WQV3_9MICO|nr:DUF3054 domain-containing protein [Pseudoclavibacter endophyticus]KAB1649337.1 DUF3054 domain-containing protein [Pseudoclavibacter endophyticus]GGA63372.1 hypothetical protein GCM10011490_12480 [Pseudoclavibacter endophyticus]
MTRLSSTYSSNRWWAIAVDVVLVVVFATTGRASHGETLTPWGIADTAWPFVVACLAAWVLVTVARWPHARVFPSGLVVWAATLAGGMGLRVLAGDTAATAFIVVAAITLAVLLLLPRLLLGRRRFERGGAAAERTAPDRSRSA